MEGKQISNEVWEIGVRGENQREKTEKKRETTCKQWGAAEGPDLNVKRKNKRQERKERARAEEKEGQTDKVEVNRRETVQKQRKVAL